MARGVGPMTSLSQGLAIAGGGGGGGGGAPTPPGGVTTEIQFNDAGAFAGTPALTFDKTTKLFMYNGAVLSPAEVAAITALFTQGIILALRAADSSIVLAARTVAIGPGAGEHSYLALSFAAVDLTGAAHAGFEWEASHAQGTATDAADSNLVLWNYYLNKGVFLADAAGLMQFGPDTHQIVLNPDGSFAYLQNGVPALSVSADGTTSTLNDSLIAHRHVGGSANNHAVLHGVSLWPNGILGSPTSVVFTNVAGATAGALVQSEHRQIACALLGPTLMTVRGTGNPKIRIDEPGVGFGPPSQHAVLASGDIFFIEATAPAVVTFVGSGFSGTWTVAT